MNKGQIASMIAEGNRPFEQEYGVPAHLLGEAQSRDLETIRRIADSLPREKPAPDAHLEAAYEDRYPEPYEGNPYDGTDNSDPGFYSDYGDE